MFRFFQKHSALFSRGASLLTGGLVLSASTLTLSGCLSRSLTGLTIQPGTGLTTVVPGVAAQFKAIGTYTESGHATTQQDVTDQVTWSTVIPAVAAVNSSGLVTGLAPGTTSIIATIGGEFGQLSAASNIVVNSATSGAVVPAKLTATGVRTAANGNVANADMTEGITNKIRIPISLKIITSSHNLTAMGETKRYLALGTYNTPPRAVDLTNQVSWVSSDVTVATVDGTGLATSVGPGQAVITAWDKASGQSVVSATANFRGEANLGPIAPPTLTTYEVGTGSGTITGPDAISCTANGGAQCTGSFPLNTTVTLTASPSTGSVFDGWSANCTPVPGKPTACTITLNNNETVGAIFDPAP